MEAERTLILDRDESVSFKFIPQNSELAGPVKNTRAFQAVDWFSQGFWIAERDEGKLKVSDLRFGETRLQPQDPLDQWQFVFSWHVGPGTDAEQAVIVDMLEQQFVMIEQMGIQNYIQIQSRASED